jgi:hypothetical protein
MMRIRVKDACPASMARTGIFLPILAALAFACMSPAPALAADPPSDDKPAPPADSQKKPASYSDDDLQKYHKPKPGTAAPASQPEAPAAASPATATGSATAPSPAAASKPGAVSKPGAAPPPAAAKKPIPAPRPPASAAASTEDPLKPWKDREARAKFREEQLQGLRDRIGALQSRLDYLNLKRLAILDPLRVMPKPQNEDDRTGDAEKGSRDLLASVEEEIKSVEADLKEAKDDLVTIETRFAQESAQP